MINYKTCLWRFYSPESLFHAHVLDDALLVRFAPLELNGLRICNDRIDEQLARLLVHPVLGNLVLVRVDLLDDAIDRLVLAYEVNRSLGADASNRLTVVTAEQDAQVDELLLRQLETFEDLLQMELFDRHLSVHFHQ